MGTMKQIAIEIDNSEVLSYLSHEIKLNSDRLVKLEALASCKNPFENYEMCSKCKFMEIRESIKYGDRGEPDGVEPDGPSCDINQGCLVDNQFLKWEPKPR